MCFPKKDNILNEYNVQSISFGHRIKGDQTVEEYLLEFLQVLISPKIIENENETYKLEYFPDIELEGKCVIKFKPKSRIDLKRLAFYGRAKYDSRTTIDTDAYNEIKNIIEDKIITDDFDRKDIVNNIENLLSSYSGVVKNRSWFAQSFLPVCKNMILPETMGHKGERRELDNKYKNRCEDDELIIEKFSWEKENYLDTKFQTNRYNFMARGGEIYYLHILRGILKNPDLKFGFEEAMKDILNSFNPINELCEFIHQSWIEADECRESKQYDEKIIKSLGFIPDDFGFRDKYSIIEMTNLLKNSMHPFEKIDTLAQGVVFQLMNLMHSEARFGLKDTRPVWVIDMTYSSKKNKEMAKVATKSYETLEDDILKKIYFTLERMPEVDEKTYDKKLKDAIEDSYKVCRKLLKEIGVLVPISGKGMRLTLKENIIKFLVISIIEPGSKLTLDTFIEKLYEHFGIVISSTQYKIEMARKNVIDVNDLSFLEVNEKEFSEMLKKCGFLRDLSDATAIVENPY